MAGEFRKEIRLVADLSSLQQDMQRVSETLKTLSNEVINVQMKINGRDANDVINDLRIATGAGGGPGTLYDAQGRPITPSQRGMNIPTEVSMERAGKAAEKFAKELDNLKNKQVSLVTAMADATTAQREVMSKELNRLQMQERTLQNMQQIVSQAGGGGAVAGGGGAGGYLAGIAERLGPMGMMSVAGAIGTGAFELPMHLMRTRAARAGITTRDIGAARNLDFEDILRLQGDVRERGHTGRRAGMARSLAGGAGWGAGLGLGAAMLLGGPVGWMAGGGALLGMGYKAVTGQVEQAGIGGFEEAVQAQIAERGPQRQMYEAAMGLSRGGMGMQLGFGIGRGRFRNMLFGGGGVASGVRQFGLSPAEQFAGMQGLGAAGGVDYAQQNLPLLQMLSRGTGLSMGQLGQATGEFGGIAGPGFDTLAEVLTRAVREGFETSEQFRRHIDAVVSLAQSAGGGAGATGFRAAMDAVNAARDVFGVQAATPGIARNMENIFTGMQTAGQGFMGVANFQAAREAMGGMTGLTPANRRRMLMLLQRLTPAMLQDNPQVQQLLKNAGVEDTQGFATNLMQRRSARQMEMFMLGGAGEGDMIGQQLQEALLSSMGGGAQGGAMMTFGQYRNARLRRAGQGNVNIGEFNEETGQFEMPHTMEERINRVMTNQALEMQRQRGATEMRFGEEGMKVLDRTVAGVQGRGGGEGIAAEVISGLDQVTKSAVTNIDKVGQAHGRYIGVLNEAIAIQERINAAKAEAAGMSDMSLSRDLAEDNYSFKIKPRGQN